MNKKRNSVFILLTPEQQKALRPLLDSVVNANMSGIAGGGAILGQVYVDGIACAFIEGAECINVQKALGGSGSNHSVVERASKANGTILPA